MPVLVKKSPTRVAICCRKGDPFQGPKLGSCLTLGNELSEETQADKARDFIVNGHPGGELEGQGNQENCSAAWRAVSGFMVMGLVSGWSLANHPNSESFLVAHASLSQEGCKEGDSWKWTDTRCLLLTFPQLLGLLEAYSVFLIRIFCHKTTHANGYYGAWPGWVVSVSVLPLTESLSRQEMTCHKSLFFSDR